MATQSPLLAKVRELEKWYGFETEIKWKAAFIVFAYHLLSIYWCSYYMFPVKIQTVLWAIVMYMFGGFGITAGAHRYWAHRAFKAKTPLRVFMLLAFSSSWQDDLRQWVLNHRVHHKYSDTLADPHNANRGLFFSHIGWLMMKKRPEVFSKWKEVDLNDIDTDKLVMWHKRNVYLINTLACFVLPVLAGVWAWGEDWRVAVAWQCGVRFLALYHSELAVNSLGHTLGTKPYDKNIRPRNNAIIAAITGGEGWHNYHHTFPFDYKAAEWARPLDLTTTFLHGFRTIGWVSDCREASAAMVEAYASKMGEKID